MRMSGVCACAIELEMGTTTESLSADTESCPFSEIVKHTEMYFIERYLFVVQYTEALDCGSKCPDEVHVSNA